MRTAAKLNENTTAEIRLKPGRAAIVFLCLGAAFVVLVARSFYLQWGEKVAFLQTRSDERFVGSMEIPASRGVILDRNGKELARSLPVKALLVRTNVLEISDKHLKTLATAAKAMPEADRVRAEANIKKLEEKRVALAKILKMSVDALRKKIDDERSVVYLAKRLSPDVADQAMALKIKGLDDENGYWRYYPLGDLTGPLVGYTGEGDSGQEGIELALQSALQSTPGMRRVLRNVKREAIEDIETVTLPKKGADITLSIDTRIQEYAYTALKEAIEKHKAKAGGAVVLDARTGEVLAMVNLPSFNPNHLDERQSAGKKNRAIVDQFEPGSTFKPLTVAFAIDSGKVTPQTMVSRDNGELVIGKYKIHDAHRSTGAISVEDVVRQSSNIGCAKIAFTMTPQQMWQGLTDAGFGVPTGTGFPGETPGRLMPAKRWDKTQQATISYGHGVTVNLLQLARAYTIFTDGELKPVSLYKVSEPVYGKPVIRGETAAKMRHILERTTERGGTGTRAQTPSYRVAGKTGTANKVENGKYSETKFVGSFVGFAPAESPRVIVAVMIDEPMNLHMGGQVAAPVFAEVVEKSLFLMNVPPDRAEANFALPPAVDDDFAETI